MINERLAPLLDRSRGFLEGLLWEGEIPPPLRGSGEGAEAGSRPVFAGSCAGMAPVSDGHPPAVREPCVNIISRANVTIITE